VWCVMNLHQMLRAIRLPGFEKSGACYAQIPPTLHVDLARSLADSRTSIRSPGRYMGVGVGSWTRIPQVASTEPGVVPSIGYDAARQHVFLFGGMRVFQERPADTWTLATPNLTVDRPTVSIATGGTQKLTRDADAQHGGRLYWIFGSVTGSPPGISPGSAVGSVHGPRLRTERQLSCGEQRGGAHLGAVAGHT
jgi:hypothetical protein